MKGDATDPENPQCNAFHATNVQISNSSDIVKYSGKWSEIGRSCWNTIVPYGVCSKNATSSYCEQV
jgi:lipocalin